MIIAACGGRGNGEKDAEGLARAESGEGSGKWEVGRVDRKKGGWGGVDGNREGGVETGRGNLEGGNGEGEMGRGAIGMGRGWQWRGGQGEEEMERGAMGKGGRWEGGNGEGGKGKEVGMGKGRRRGKRRGDFTDGYDGMPVWT